MATKKSESSTIEIVEFKTGEITLPILGASPFIYNRLSEKAKRELLLGGKKKTKAEKEQSQKHDPEAEFRSSVYQRKADGPTRLVMPSPAFKGSMSTAALEIPGVYKTQIDRLVWVTGQHVDMYGIPELFMTAVRSADMNKTPDIRTRAILPRWACSVTLRFASPTLNETTIVNLLSAAGLITGVGDFRQEKGKGNYGQFEVVAPDNAEWHAIVDSCGQAAQDKALAEATPYDDESYELLAWYHTEIRRRGLKEAA